MIDLRSDTVTLPTEEMRELMRRAEVGDDVYQEDPSINQLEAISAGLMGKEEGLFIPSGTMGNLIAVLAVCQRGDEVIMGNMSHTFLYEAGGISALGGIFAHTLPNQPDGTLKLDHIRGAIRGEDIHEPQTRMIVLENTHNRCGGVALAMEYVQAVQALARSNNLWLHLDGARIFNAAIKLNREVIELVSPYDSITFCLSKGLGAPVGSVLCGSSQFIAKARRLRKQLGGGMRQAGILAAAGIYALQNHVNRLADDHRRAIVLAEGLKKIDGIQLIMNTPQTNMLYISIEPGEGLDMDALGTVLLSEEVKVGISHAHTMRLVTHLGISDEDIKTTIQAFKKVLINNRRPG